MSKSTRKPKKTPPTTLVLFAAYWALTGRDIPLKQSVVATNQFITDLMGPRDRDKLYARCREVQLQWRDMTYTEVGDCVRIEGYTYGHERKGL